MGFFDNVTPHHIENASSFSRFQIGDNVVRIAKVEETYSKSGNAMLVVYFENDSGAEIRHYIVENEYKYQKLKELYLAFGIPFTENNYRQWVGKRGVVVCKEGEIYNGRTRPEVSYLKPLPAQSKGSAATTDTYPRETADGFTDDVPF
jgi:hypothetical protein